MVFSYSYGQQQNWWCKQMQENHWQFQSPWGCGSTMRFSLPNGAHPGLHLKPLDAAIGQVPVRYCPGGCHGWRYQMKCKNTNKTQLLASNYCTLFVHNPSNFCYPKWTLYSAHRCNKLHKNMIHQLLELVYLQTFLAIKCCQQIKIL